MVDATLKLLLVISLSLAPLHSRSEVLDKMNVAAQYVATPVYLVFCLDKNQKLEVFRQPREVEPLCPSGMHLITYVITTYMAKYIRDKLSANTNSKELITAAKKEGSEVKRILVVDLIKKHINERPEDIVKSNFPFANIKTIAPYNESDLRKSLEELKALGEKFDLIVTDTHGAGMFGDPGRPIQYSEVGQHSILGDNGFLLWLGCQSLHSELASELRQSAAMFTDRDEVKLVGTDYISLDVSEGLGVPKFLHYIAAPIAQLSEGVNSFISWPQNSFPVELGLPRVRTQTIKLNGCLKHLAQ